MKIGEIVSGIQRPPLIGADQNQPAKTGAPSFGDVLSNFVSDVNSLQTEASDTVKRFAAGEVSDLHEVMIATEKAKTSLELLMEIRNKAIDAYRELMRTSV